MNEIVYGKHSVCALLKYNPKNIIKIYISEKNKNYNILKKIKELNINFKIIDYKWLNKKTNGAVHQGVLAYINIKRFYKEKDLIKLFKYKNISLLLILDSVTDPHNLGACLRCAEAAGVQAVIIPRNKSVKLNSTVKKVSSGASEAIPLIYVTNISRTLCILRKFNIRIIGTTVKTKKFLYQSKLNRPIAFVMGSENKGIRYLTSKYCDEFIKIPMLGTVSSLNVSVATAICLFETIRQRNKFY
ncbi:MAG: 23S rRNA (guanosine(2251)-2'-O)-methyltransferase RlmB [gamma proteobacterium endosymbiont of Trioza apicalis]